MANPRSTPVRPPNREFERILLVKPSSLGDVVHALPVLHGLRRRFPRARIDWLIATAFAPLLEGHPDLDALVPFDRSRYGGVGRNAGATGAFIRFMRDLRRRRYDLVVDLQGLFRTGFLTRVTGATVRVGFHDAREGAWLFYNDRIAAGNGDRHAVDRNYDVAAALGFADVPIEFNLALDSAEISDAAGLLANYGLPDGASWLAVVPGARWETKVWPEERFVAAVDSLVQEARLPVVLLGGPDERDLCTRIEHGCRARLINLAGRTSLRQLAALISRAAVVLAHDSAPMHFAVALDRPLVCLIGPTNPRRTGPYRRPEDVLRVELDCAPCYLRKRSQCPYDHRCMADLKVDRVVRAVLQRAPQLVAGRGPTLVARSGSDV